MLRLRLLPLLLLPAGCGTDSPTLATTESAQELAIPGGRFDAARAGSVTGRVTWQGPIPEAPGFLYGVIRPDGLGFEFRKADNPNRPQIDPATRAIADAVVFLRGVDAASARPWDLPPVQVEIGAGRIAVVQGQSRGRVGFVRRGDAIDVASTEAVYHVLRGRGDAFFSLTLPEPHRPVKRTLVNPGRVELSSGSGVYWVRADLFVTDHPYYAVTDSNGQFVLDRVPSGKVELVVWLPGWQPARQERDPDSTVITRQVYSPPLEKVTHVTINPARPAEVNVSVP